MVRTHGFKRASGTVGAAAVAVVTALAIGASPSVSAPAEDCAEPYPIANLTDGQPVTGLTVQPVVGNAASKTEPAPFTGEVLGVVHDGIAPGLDMIMMRLTSSEIDRVGIWAGMSGSPVYAANGQLIGAVAYGLSFGPSPVAGVTPFADMDDYLASPAAKHVDVSAQTASKIAAASDVTSSEASGGFSQLPVHTTVSGVTAQRLDRASGDRTWLNAGVRSGGSSSSLSAISADTIVAGGNLGAAASWGDITAGGVGTATSVCNGKVVGFGHPMFFSGKTSVALLPASALYIQEDPTLVPFKVANLGEPVGTITDDRLAGITGSFGPVPRAVTITENLTYGDRTRTGSSKVSVKSWNPDVTFYQQLANHDRVLDGIIAGSEGRTWTITGKKPDGTPFALAQRNRYTSAEDIAFEVPWEVADQVWVLSSIPGVTLDSVDIEGVVTDDTTSYTVAAVQQNRAGQWVTIEGGRALKGTAGQIVQFRVVLANDDGSSTTIPAKVKFPGSAGGKLGTVKITGQNTDYDYEEDEEGEFPEGDLDELLAYYEAQTSSDQISGILNVAGRRISFASAPADKEIFGSIRVPVRVLAR